jgi:lipopolysaccharide export system protein LptA
MKTAILPEAFLLLLGGPAAAQGKPPAQPLQKAGTPAARPDAGADSLKGKIFGEAKPIDIKSDSLKVFHKEHYGMFTGNVVADRRDVQLFCRELRAEYDEKGQVERLICNGNVRVVMGQKETTGAKAVFENTKDLITVSGDPVLKDGDDHMRGDLVIFNLADDTVQVDKPRGKVTMKPRDEKPGAPAPLLNKEKK